MLLVDFMLHWGDQIKNIGGTIWVPELILGLHTMVIPCNKQLHSSRIQSPFHFGDKLVTRVRIVTDVPREVPLRASSTSCYTIQTCSHQLIKSCPACGSAQREERRWGKPFKNLFKGTQHLLKTVTPIRTEATLWPAGDSQGRICPQALYVQELTRRMCTDHAQFPY